jgi:hypothetical protein
MAEGTRAALAAGALTSAAVAGALAVFEHRRLEQLLTEQRQLRRQTSRLADASVARLLRAIAHGYRFAVTDVALELDREEQGADVLSWTRADLGGLAKALVWFANLGVPDRDQRSSEAGRIALSDLVLGIHIAADVLVAGREAGLLRDVPAVSDLIASDVAETRDELARFADALLLQNAPDDAEPLLELRADIDLMWRVAGQHLPWGADLAGVLAAWLTDSPRGVWTKDEFVERLELVPDRYDGEPLMGVECRTWLTQRTAELLDEVADAVRRRR